MLTRDWHHTHADDSTCHYSASRYLSSRLHVPIQLTFHQQPMQWFKCKLCKGQRVKRPLDQYITWNWIWHWYLELEFRLSSHFLLTKANQMLKMMETGALVGNNRLPPNNWQLSHFLWIGFEPWTFDSDGIASRNKTHTAGRAFYWWHCTILEWYS